MSTLIDSIHEGRAVVHPRYHWMFMVLVKKVNDKRVRNMPQQQQGGCAFASACVSCAPENVTCRVMFDMQLVAALHPLSKGFQDGHCLA